MGLKYILKVIFINLMVFLTLIIIMSFLLHAVDTYKNYTKTHDEISNNSKYNRNTIRATYPVYSQIKPEEAISLFRDYQAPGTSYYPFTGWRRNPYSGTAVNIDKKYRTRKSLNNKFNDSVWFFGGSTMWGTGSKDSETIPSQYARFTGENVWNLGESGYNSFQEFVHI